MSDYENTHVQARLRSENEDREKATTQDAPGGVSDDDYQHQDHDSNEPRGRYGNLSAYDEAMTSRPDHDPASEEGGDYSGQTHDTGMSPHQYQHQHQQHGTEDDPGDSYGVRTDETAESFTVPGPRFLDEKDNEWEQRERNRPVESQDYDGNITEHGDDRYATFNRYAAPDFSPGNPSGSGDWESGQQTTGHVSDSDASAKKGDSVMGKMMEKAGDVLRNEKIVEKGREKREEKAEQGNGKMVTTEWKSEGNEYEGTS